MLTPCGNQQPHDPHDHCPGQGQTLTVWHPGHSGRYSGIQFTMPPAPPDGPAPNEEAPEEEN